MHSKIYGSLVCFPENIRTIIWLYTLKPSNINIYLDEEWIDLCRVGCYQLIRWILNNQNIIHINLWQGFKKALLYGTLIGGELHQEDFLQDTSIFSFLQNSEIAKYLAVLASSKIFFLEGVFHFSILCLQPKFLLIILTYLTSSRDSFLIL